MHKYLVILCACPCSEFTVFWHTIHCLAASNTFVKVQYELDKTHLVLVQVLRLWLLLPVAPVSLTPRVALVVRVPLVGATRMPHVPISVVAAFSLGRVTELLVDAERVGSIILRFGVVVALSKHFLLILP